jgi:hypothetical protein
MKELSMFFEKLLEISPPFNIWKVQILEDEGGQKE